MHPRPAHKGAAEAGLPETLAPGRVVARFGQRYIVALDAQGSQVQDVTLTPSHAQVVIHMVRAPAVKSVPVSPDLGLLYAPGPIFARPEKWATYWPSGTSYVCTDTLCLPKETP